MTRQTLVKPREIDVPRRMDGIWILFPQSVHLISIVGICSVCKRVIGRWPAGKSIGSDGLGGDLRKGTKRWANEGKETADNAPGQHLVNHSEYEGDDGRTDPRRILYFVMAEHIM